MSHKKNKPLIIKFFEKDDDKWGIDVHSVSKLEKECILQLQKLLYDEEKWHHTAICIAHKLLDLRPNCADYAFICGYCYYNMLIWSSVEKELQINIFGFELQSYDYYEPKSRHYYKTALELEPNHPIYLYYWSQFLSDDGAEYDCWMVLEQLRKLLQNDAYVKHWRNHKQIPNYYTFEHYFQMSYLFTLDKFKDDDNELYINSRMLYKEINHLFERYLSIMDKHSPNKQRHLSATSHKYACYFSLFGEYTKAHQAFSFQYQEKESGIFDRIALKSCINSCLAVNDYSKAVDVLYYLCTSYKQEARESKNARRKRMNCFYGYLWRVFVEMEMYQYMKQVQKCKLNSYLMEKLHKRPHIYEDDIDESSYFALFNWCYYTYLHKKHQTKSDTKLVRRTWKEMNNRLNSDERFTILHVDESFYVMAMMHRLPSADEQRNVFNLRSSTQCFLSCLDATIKYYTRNEVFKAEVPLSYYYMAMNAVDLQQYHIAIKLFKKANRITKNIKIIDKNCKIFIKKCRKELMQQKCDYCQQSNQMLRSCKACGDRYYCSKHCQKMDWKVKNHRHLCSKLWSNKYQLTKHVWWHTESSV